MANSLMQIVSDGSLSTIPLTIQFFEQSHIKVFVNNVELPDGIYTFAWSGATTITITPAVALGVEVSIRRKTPANEVLHDFQAGAVFSEVSVDENFRQELFLLQEASEQSFVTDLFEDLDMHGNGVRNVRTATLPGDAVNLAQAQFLADGGEASDLRDLLASPIGTTLIGFEQTVIDATLRSFGKFVEQYGAVGNDDGLAGGVDDTAAFQAALDAGGVIRLAAGKRYRITSQLVIKNLGTTFVGPGILYGGSQVTYYGSGAMFVAESAVSYVQITGGGHFNSVLSVPTDAYRTGTIFLDQQAGNVSAKVIGCWISNFEYIFYGNYNSFYNLIENSRVTDFRYCYYRFNINNLNIKTTRFLRFNTLALLNGTDGPSNIRENSFEMFNGPICQFSGVEEGQVNFEENYVEIFDSTSTPTNFPQNANGNLGKYGGNTLFSGPIRNFVSRGNNLQIGGAFRFLSTASAMKYIESTGNQVSLYATGNNIDRMYTAASCDNVYICDVRGPNHGGDGGYTRTYAQTAIPTPLSDSIYRHWDCLLGKMLRPNRLTALSMLNGWASSDVSHGIARCELTADGYTALQGLIDGVASTSSTIFFIPTNKRPFEYGSTSSYANFTVFSTWGGGSIVRLRYLYATGELRYEGTPTSLFNLPLDGILIPPRV